MPHIMCRRDRERSFVEFVAAKAGRSYFVGCGLCAAALQKGKWRAARVENQKRQLRSGRELSGRIGLVVHRRSGWCPCCVGGTAGIRGVATVPRPHLCLVFILVSP